MLASEQLEQMDPKKILSVALASVECRDLDRAVIDRNADFGENGATLSGICGQ